MSESKSELQSHAKAYLSRLIGRWTNEFTCGQMPGPMRGESAVEWIAEGASVIETVTTDMFGAESKSIRTLAFNPLRGLIEAASVEGAGVGIATGSGRPPAPGATFCLISRVDEARAGLFDIFTEAVTTWRSENERVMEIYTLGQAGERQLIGTATSVRSR